MLKGSRITALALTLTSFIVGITTQIAYAQQSIEHPVSIVEDSKDSTLPKCSGKKCPVMGNGGNTPPSHRESTSPTSTTNPKLNQEFEIVPAATPVKSGSN